MQNYINRTNISLLIGEGKPKQNITPSQEEQLCDKISGSLIEKNIGFKLASKIFRGEIIYDFQGACGHQITETKILSRVTNSRRKLTTMVLRKTENTTSGLNRLLNSVTSDRTKRLWCHFFVVFLYQLQRLIFSSSLLFWFAPLISFLSIATVTKVPGYCSI